ncbi:MAG TPA: FKBP-type peptidyl-prolyl cis-trans isomerase [Steroidobacteraceae bacterium]|nr:FKBP-type peptidyl-prolyl cis-trans isomerase [Steroidobacteraceae bacterium]
MRLPARRRAFQILTVHAAALVVLLAGATLAQAQQSSSGTPAAAGNAAPAKKPAQKSAAPKAASSPKGDASYSLGVSMGQQLRSSGVTASEINTERLAAGVHDALAKGVAPSATDRDNIRGLLNSVGEANHKKAAAFLAENGKKPGIVTTASGLEYQVLAAGSGESPKPTDEVTVNYRGTLLDGTEFDSSYKRGEAATFQVNRVIPGWTEALSLMKPGAKYKLFIPPQLAYDLRSPPPIPPGSLLLFDVELVSIKAAPPAPAAPAAPAPAQPPK